MGTGAHEAPSPLPAAGLGGERAAYRPGVLTDLGFGPEVGPGDEVRLRTCPILDSATTNPDVICSVHHGLVEGIRGALWSG